MQRDVTLSHDFWSIAVAQPYVYVMEINFVLFVQCFVENDQGFCDRPKTKHFYAPGLKTYLPQYND